MRLADHPKKLGLLLLPLIPLSAIGIGEVVHTLREPAITGEGCTLEAMTRPVIERVAPPAPAPVNTERTAPPA